MNEAINLQKYHVLMALFVAPIPLDDDPQPAVRSAIAIHREKAKSNSNKDDSPKAKEQLSRAIDSFKGCGADGWVKRYEKELAML